MDMRTTVKKRKQEEKKQVLEIKLEKNPEEMQKLNTYKKQYSGEKFKFILYIICKYLIFLYIFTFARIKHTS